MGNGTGTAAAMEGIHASTARLDALFLEDARLEADASAGDGGSGAAVVDVLQRRYEIRLERMAVTKQLEAQIAAVKARDATGAIEIQHAMTPPGAPVHERTYAEMSAVEEIAGVLTISSPAAGALITESRQLASLPPAMDALSAGTISWQHAKIIADETDSLGPTGAAALVEHVLNPNPARGAAAGDLVPGRFRIRVRNWRERHHPESLEKRHAKSAADRRMEYTPDRDGMAWVSLYLPAHQGTAIWNRTTAIARGLQGPHEPRTITQLRPDIAATLLLGAPAAAGTAEHEPSAGNGYADLGNVPVPKADVLVTVPVLALFDITDEPANLDGYGPIPASMARKLVANGASAFYRVLVDPRDGAPLEIGRTNYRLTKPMKKALQLRDGKCTFPGCNNPSLDNETDHLQAWQHGGNTGISNLAQLCPKHHRLKHATGWTPNPATEHEPPGWTSPTGRHYKAEQPDHEPPQWPPGLLTPATDTARPLTRATETPELPVPAPETPGLPVPAPETPGLLTHAKDAPETPGRLTRATDTTGFLMPAQDSPATESTGFMDFNAPFAEPIDDNLEDPHDFPPDDPIWDDFYAHPPQLPKDPIQEWQRKRAWDMVNS